MKSLLKSIPGTTNLYRLYLRLFRRRYWITNARNDNLRAFTPLNYPAQLFWSEVAPRLTGTVLEMGCGNGRDLIVAAGNHPDCRFIGVDIQRESISFARANAKDLVNAEFLCGDICDVLADLHHLDAFLSCASLIYLAPHELKTLMTRLKSLDVRVIMLAEITSKTGDTIKTHLYIHPYDRVFGEFGFTHRCRFFPYEPWEGPAFQGAIHIATVDGP